MAFGVSSLSLLICELQASAAGSQAQVSTGLLD
jgi:hypothetical protein